jgi:hypothetical protein
MGLFDAFKKKQESTEDAKQAIYNLPADYKLLEETVQDFIPFTDIENSMICLKDSKYRMVIEVSSVNYYLKTAEEQEVLEAQFRAAIGSFDFPFAFYVQTRKIDGEQILQGLREDTSKFSRQHIYLIEYANQYLKEMEKMYSYGNSALVKKNYIIVSCDDESAAIGNNRTESEKRQVAFEKLSLSVQKVFEGLRPMGLRCHCLTNEELSELLYTALNKRSEFKADNIVDSMSEFVDSDAGLSKIDDKITLMLEGFKNQAQTLINTSMNLSDEDLQKAYRIIERLNNIESENDYSQDVSGDSYFEL